MKTIVLEKETKHEKNKNGKKNSYEEDIKMPELPNQTPQPMKPKKPPYYNAPNKKKWLAILFWFLGGFGFYNIHNFYLGKIKMGLIKLGMILVSSVLCAAGFRDGGIVFLGVIGMLSIYALLVWNIVEIVHISKLGKLPENIQNIQRSQEEAKARLEKSQKGYGGKILGLFVSIFLIIGGASGQMVLRGTESSTALVVVGVLFLIWDVVSIATHKSSLEKAQAKQAAMEANKEGPPEQTVNSSDREYTESVESAFLSDVSEVSVSEVSKEK